MKIPQDVIVHLEHQFKLKMFKYAEVRGSCKEAYEAFGIKKTTFYSWKRKFEKDGERGLLRKKRDSMTYWNSLSSDVVELILKLRSEHKLGTWRIKWYMERYKGITVSESSVYRTLKRNNVKPLDKKTTRRAMHTIRYEKTTPGHHVQVDVKFLIFSDEKGKKIRRFQYTAIDDATRVRALKVYKKHNQLSSIDFINYVVDKFPFRIHTIQTDNGHEFQSKFHWHVQDLGMQQRFIKPGTPQHNGKVERSHLTDKMEFYQLFDYKDDVDLNKKMNDWEQYYNFDRPHGAFKGKTPYEVLVSKLKG